MQDNNILFEVPHIKLTHAAAGMYCLVVENTELNDYVEDFLWDDLEYSSTSVSVTDRSAPAVYHNTIDASFPLEKLVEKLNQRCSRSGKNL